MKDVGRKIIRAYRAAWFEGTEAGDPAWLQMVWRLVIFGLPVAILITSVIYGIHREEWSYSITTILCTLIVHPLTALFVYRTFYETIFDRNENDELS